MMDDRLLMMLQKLNDTEAQLEGMLYFLEILDEYYERKNLQEICYGVQVLSGWMCNLKIGLINVMDDLDEYTLNRS